MLLTFIGLLFISNINAQVITGFSNVTDTDGNTHSLSNYLNDGKYVILNFYLLTCGNCMATAPNIESIYNDYGQNQCNVVVLSFLVDNSTIPTPTNVDCDNWAVTYGVPSPPNFNYTEADWYQFYAVHGGGFAQTYLITPNGNSVIYAHSGGVLDHVALRGVLDVSVTDITSSSAVTACDSYIWNGTTYTASGTQTWVGANSNGCDSTSTLILTINNSTTSTSNVTVTNSYEWNGITYTASGVYTYNTTSLNGCDSTAILDLTITNISTVLDIKNNTKTMLKVIDILGRETKATKKNPLFYIYDDGTVEKRIIIE